MVTQKVNNLPAMQETQVRSLDREDPLEEEIATHSSILAGESHGQRSLVGYGPWGGSELGTNEATEHADTHCDRHCIVHFTSY